VDQDTPVSRTLIGLKQGEWRCSLVRSRGAADDGCREGEDTMTSIFFLFLLFLVHAFILNFLNIGCHSRSMPTLIGGPEMSEIVSIPV
jgi:hypothetical protein